MIAKTTKESHNKFAITVDDGLYGRLLQIMNSHSEGISKKYQKNSFHCLFGEQQAFNLSNTPHSDDDVS